MSPQPSHIEPCRASSPSSAKAAWVRSTEPATSVSGRDVAITVLVWSKYSRGSVVVSKQATETIPTTNCSTARLGQGRV